MTTQDDRAAFEEYAASQGLRDFERSGLHDYRNVHVQGVYNYWLASKAHKRQLKPVQAEDLIRRSDVIVLVENTKQSAFTPISSRPFLDAIKFTEAINTIPAISNEQNKSAVEAVAKVVHYPSYSSLEWIIGVFEQAKLPNGTKLFSAQQQPQITNKKEG